MKVAIASIAAAAAALTAASMLGVAAAEAPTTTPTRTVSVQGVAIVPIEQTANAGQADAAYRAGLAAAVADGQGKAAFLAGKAGAGLGVVQSIVEDGGYISCTGGDEQTGAEYRGEQPDFGSTTSAPGPLRASGVAAPKPAVQVRRPTSIKRRHHGAKVAAAVSCTLSAQVSLAYVLG